MQVEVKRRETERQQQFRLKSYAYISKQEADEKWTPITMNPADSNSAAVLWDKLASGPETQLPLDLSREEYLSACLPCKLSALEQWICPPSKLPATLTETLRSANPP